MNVTLVGNPNVGKSSLFARITGSKITASNYPGTTVSTTRGTLSCSMPGCIDHHYLLHDSPGVYCIENPKAPIELVTKALIEKSDLIINVVDATHLAQGLYITSQLKKRSTPVIMALNLWDEASYQGITIDTKKLSAELTIPIIPTVGLTGSGIKELVKQASMLLHKKTTIPKQTCENSRSHSSPSWANIEALVQKVETRSIRKKTWRESLEVLTVSPLPGTIIALGVLFGTFALVALAGESLEGGIDFILERTLTPLLLALNQSLAFAPWMQTILIGQVTGSTINYGEAMGLITSGLYIPLVKVAPVVALFYGILGILEDSGYLPRLATLSDTMMHRFSLHGFAILPMMLGAGCSVTGIVASRILTSHRQRIIVSILVSMTIPCTAQTAVILSLVGPMGGGLVALLFGVLIMLWYIMGRILGAREKESYREMLMEMPPLRLPRIGTIMTKLYVRMRHFITDAIPITIGGIAIVILCNYIGLFALIGDIIGPIGSWLWGIPRATIPILIMGLFRKEIALSFLASVPGLHAGQLFTIALLLCLYFPCISVYTILYREFGLTTLIGMVALMFGLSSFVGVLVHGVLLLM